MERPLSSGLALTVTLFFSSSASRPVSAKAGCSVWKFVLVRAFFPGGYVIGLRVTPWIAVPLEVIVTTLPVAHRVLEDRVRDLDARLLVRDRRGDPVVQREQDQQERPDPPREARQHRRLRRRRRAAAVGARARPSTGSGAASCRRPRCSAAGAGPPVARATSEAGSASRTSRGAYQPVVTSLCRRSRRSGPRLRRNPRARAAPRAARSRSTGRAPAGPRHAGRRGSAVPIPEFPSGYQHDAQDAAQAERAAEREVLEAGEVAERVRDQAAVVLLDAAQDVRSRSRRRGRRPR